MKGATHLWYLSSISNLLCGVCQCVLSYLLPAGDHWTLNPVPLLREMAGEWGPPPQRHRTLTPPHPPLLPTWTHPSPRPYIKSALTEVVQSHQNLHQVRQATAVALTETCAVQKVVRRDLLVGNFFIYQSDLLAVCKIWWSWNFFAGKKSFKLWLWGVSVINCCFGKCCLAFCDILAFIPILRRSKDPLTHKLLDWDGPWYLRDDLLTLRTAIYCKDWNRFTQQSRANVLELSF